MATEKKLQAQALYFQTDLNKTQIASAIGISRRALHYWIRESNWDRLKKSSTIMPAMLAENCYHIMHHFTRSLMSETRAEKPITRDEADTLHRLTLTIKKLKNHSTLNESMEMLAHFMERVSDRAPELAEQLAPFMNEHMEGFAAQSLTHVRPPHLNDQGLIPAPAAEPDVTETREDLSDLMTWHQEQDQRQTAQTGATSISDEEARERKEEFHKALSFYNALGKEPETPVEKAPSASPSKMPTPLLKRSVDE